METETAFLAVDMLADRPLTIQFAGGEPLLNIQVVQQVCQYAVSNLSDVRFSIQTNGINLTDSVIDLLKRYRIAIGVSLDGRPVTNDYLRGQTAAVVRGINLLRSHDLATNINAVISSCNVSLLGELVDMAVYLGNINGIGLDLLRTAGRAAEDTGGELSVQPADQQSLTNGLIELHGYLKKINSVYQPGITVREFKRADDLLRTQIAGSGYCYAALARSFVVLPNGDCYPCGSLAGDNSYCMGNVHDAVRPLALACERPAGCESCRYGAFCPCGCPSRSILSGGFDELDCVMRKTTFELVGKKA
jgi:uncharacterized protein